MVGWFAVQAVVNKEKYAIENLRRQGFEAWCPMILKMVRRGRRTVSVQRPLFPGYVFVEIDLETQRWRSIDGTRGVTRLLKFGERPARLPKELVSGMLALTNEFGVVEFSDPLDPGDEVQVISGTFDNWIGKVMSLPDQERVTLLIDAVSRQVPVTVLRRDVVKAA